MYYIVLPRSRGAWNRERSWRALLSITFHEKPTLPRCGDVYSLGAGVGGHTEEGLRWLLTRPHFTEEAIKEKMSTGFGITPSLVGSYVPPTFPALCPALCSLPVSDSQWSCMESGGGDDTCSPGSGGGVGQGGALPSHSTCSVNGSRHPS